LVLVDVRLDRPYRITGEGPLTWVKETSKAGQKDGTCRTLSGRRRGFSGAVDKNARRYGRKGGHEGEVGEAQSGAVRGM